MTKYATELEFWKQLLNSGNVPPQPDGRFMRHLCCGSDYFDGMKVLEIGSSPLAWSLDFTGCEWHALDPLIDEYRAIGYKLPKSTTYHVGFSEVMPFPDGSFDAVVAFNSLDHVDDFEQTCKEIVRVCNGIIRVELHYHEAWECEPMVLDDARVRKAFPKSVKKLVERPFGDTFFPGHPVSPSYDGSVALWSNDPTLVL